MPAVKPELLVWARETAGLTIEAAAAKIGLDDRKAVTAAERLAAMESGREEVSRSVLLEMARAYHRPLIAFYLSRPPAKGKRGADFRSLHGAEDARDEVLLDALLRDIHARQSMVRVLLIEDEDSEPCAFVGSHSLSDSVPAVLESLRGVLRLDLRNYRKPRKASDAFDLLRGRIEAAGVFVLLKGDLGSHHSRIDIETFRGFSLADRVAPFLVIHDHDAAPAQSFTLLHETVHLLLGQTGVGGALVSESPEERFCDEVAAEFLFPAAELRDLRLPGADFEDLDRFIAAFADERNLSRTMVALRLARAGRVAWSSYRRLSERWRAQWIESRRKEAEESDGGPNFQTVRKRRLGGRLIEVVKTMVSADEISTGRAARILGVSAGQVGPLLGIGA